MGNLLKGKPDKDIKRLTNWWGREFAEAGLSGSVTVEHSAYEDTAAGWGAGKAMVMALAGSEQVPSEHIYRTLIVGAPWPVTAYVMCAHKGLITTISYELAFKKRIDGELVFTMGPGTWGLKSEFEGAGADGLNADKDLVQTLKKSLSFLYMSTFSHFKLDSATYQLAPSEEGSGTDVVVTTTVKAPQMGWGKKSFNLAKILPALEKLETALA